MNTSNLYSISNNISITYCPPLQAEPIRLLSLCMLMSLQKVCSLNNFLCNITLPSKHICPCSFLLLCPVHSNSNYILKSMSEICTCYCGILSCKIKRKNNLITSLGLKISSINIIIIINLECFHG